MRHAKHIALTITTILALSAYAIASASAATEMLPEGTPSNPVKFTSTSGKGSLEQKGATFGIECTKDEGTGTTISAKLGTFDILFLGCTTLGGLVKCTGLRDTVSGSILLTGTFHYWLGLQGTAKVDVIVYLPTETHLECGGTLILLKGCAAGSVSPVGTLTSAITVKLAKASKGVNEITKVINESGSEIECKLESKEGTNGFEQSNLVTTEEFLGFTQGGLSITVLMMQ